MSSQKTIRPGQAIEIVPTAADATEIGLGEIIRPAADHADTTSLDDGSGATPDQGAAAEVEKPVESPRPTVEPENRRETSNEQPGDPAPPEAAGRAAHGPSMSAALAPMGSLSRPLAQVVDETARWGRDDLKRGEAGSQGETPLVGVGAALSHLVGLGDEEPGRRNGEKMSSSDNERFVGETASVGSGLDHLWLLGDFEYTRASVDDPDEDVFPFRDDQAPSYGPLSEPLMAFSGREDTALRGRIFDPSIAALTVSQRSITVDPASGNAVFNADGTFEFVPRNGFSGVATLSFELPDPRTGLKETGVITVVVAAVADPASISGAATTPEDTRVATPITVTLNDPDGSETIEKVVISGLPAGATLHWDGALPGAVTPQLGGRFIVTGSTKQIQDLLASLAVTPPENFHGRITLGVDVTVVESNTNPSLPGYMDRSTTHFDYALDVIAVADAVTATGATQTTD
ncbi:MAG: hypothetical protein KGP27_03730 [Hyphomicrobiales bacterium]|nr:hypothetical protein [Hyphomicrobiales bacterium]